MKKLDPEANFQRGVAAAARKLHRTHAGHCADLSDRIIETEVRHTMGPTSRLTEAVRPVRELLSPPPVRLRARATPPPRAEFF